MSTANELSAEEAQGAAGPYVHVEHVMGTTVSIDLRGCTADTAEAGAAGVIRWLHEVDAAFSTYRPDSAISRIERGELTIGQADDDIAWVLGRCEELRRETDGFFDARAHGPLDPSALVKGWAVQRAADDLTRRGITDFCLSAGGDVVCRGGREPGLPWRIGIQHPYDRAAVAAVLQATDLAVATSGTYERGSHIVDPHTRRAPRAVVSVTVCGPDLGTADAYSTAAFAMGHEAAAWTLSLDGYEAMTVTEDDTVFTTPGFPLADPGQDTR